MSAEALVKCKELLDQMDRMEREGKAEGPEYDKLCEEAEDLWKMMHNEEREQTMQYNAMLWDKLNADVAKNS